MKKYFALINYSLILLVLSGCFSLPSLKSLNSDEEEDYSNKLFSSKTQPSNMNKISSIYYKGINLAENSGYLISFSYKGIDLRISFVDEKGNVVVAIDQLSSDIWAVGRFYFNNTINLKNVKIQFNGKKINWGDIVIIGTKGDHYHFRIEQILKEQ